MMGSNPIPARVTPPGQVLREEIEARRWTQKGFASITGKSERVITGIVEGTLRITPDTAEVFGKALGTSSIFWINLEANYCKTLAKKRAT